MKANRELNVLEYSGKKVRLNDVLDRLVKKDTKGAAIYLAVNTHLPRELRTMALRYVLNDYAKVAKELKLSDEVMYRLNWYPKYSETLLVNFWRVLATDNSDRFNVRAESRRFKETFYLLLLMNADRVGFKDEHLQRLLALGNDDNERFEEFMEESNGAFYDFDYTLDGMSFEDFKNQLTKCATVNDIRQIGQKFDIDVPKRLRKEELVALVCDGLRRQGKYSEEQEEALTKMNAQQVQRFAKENNIKASTEMKKEDIIDYVMNHLEASEKAKTGPSIALETLPEIENFVFYKNYIKEEFVAEEDTGAEPAPEILQPQVEEEPIEEIPVDDVPEIVEEPAQEPEPEKQPEVEEEPNYVEQLAELEETEQKEDVNEQLLKQIYEVLDERDKKDLVADLLEDSRYQTVMKMYEDRIGFLEHLINDMRTTPIPISVTVNATSNTEPVERPQEVVAQPIVEEEPIEEVVVETQPEENEEPEYLIPVIHEVQFEDLDKGEKRAIAQELMTDSRAVIYDYKEDVSKREPKKLRKLEKRQAKIDKMKIANEKTVYKRNRRRKFWKVIRRIFFFLILLFLLMMVFGVLVHYNVLKTDNSFVGAVEGFLTKIPFYQPLVNGIASLVDKIKGLFA